MFSEIINWLIRLLIPSFGRNYELGYIEDDYYYETETEETTRTVSENKNTMVLKDHAYNNVFINMEHLCRKPIKQISYDADSEVTELHYTKVLYTDGSFDTLYIDDTSHDDLAEEIESRIEELQIQWKENSRQFNESSQSNPSKELTESSSQQS